VSQEELVEAVRVMVCSAYESVAPLTQSLEAASEAFASQGDDEGIDKAEKVDAFLEALETAAKTLEVMKGSVCILYYISLLYCSHGISQVISQK
jgi:hypothetical protein